ncbi:MAG: fibronectin type III domain-containing protein, partial [Candidatus Zophobacter franzmannii]|nr:fibronectin type III domain-containing protein [Candidatus Zophobacter franzmannii]
MKLLTIILLFLLTILSIFADGTNTNFGAPIVNTLPYTDTGDVIDNTNENGERGRDEWWEISPAIDLTNLNIHVDFALWDGYLFIYDSNMTQIAFNDDGPYGGYYTSEVIINVNAGSTIYICVDEYSASTGARAFTLNISGDQTGTIVDADAPDPISNIVPSSGSIDIALLPTLTWDFGLATETYDVLFDTVYPPVTQVVTGAASGTIGSYTPVADLVEYTTYYWQVICHNSITTTATINNMTFMTLDMSTGHIENAYPANDSLHIALDQVITWGFAANAETYDFYFDTVYPPVTQIVADGAVTGSGTYTPTLQIATYYYWKVVSKNSTSLRDTEDLMNFQTTFGTDVLTIGNGTEINHHLPIEPYVGYSYSQTIYLQSEIDRTGFVDKIYYQFNMGGALTNNNQWAIYMAHTPNNSFASTTDWLPMSSFTEVYNGPLPRIPVDGWIEFILTTPFVYNNTDNLVIAVEENQPSYGSSGEKFFGTTVADPRSICYFNDRTNPDPASPPTASATPTIIPNTRFYFNSSLQSVSILEDTEYMLPRMIGDEVISSWSRNNHFTITEYSDSLLIVPEENWFGAEAISFYNNSLQEVHCVVVMVESVNDNPIIENPISGFEVIGPNLIVYANLGTVFSDVEDAILTYDYIPTPNFNINIDGTNRLEITPSIGFSGSEMVFVSATDSENATVVDSFMVLVLDNYLYSENFDYAGSIPTQWTIEHAGSTTTDWTPFNESGDDYAMQVSNSIFANSVERLVSTAVDFSTVRDIEIHLQSDFLTTDGSSTGYIQYSIANGAWLNLLTINATASELLTIPASEFDYQTNVRLRFTFISSEWDPNHWIIDDLSITGIVDDVTIPEVTGLALSPASANSMTLNWDQYSGDLFSTYEVEYSNNEYFSNSTIVNNVEYMELNDKTTTTLILDVPNLNTIWYFRIRVKFVDRISEYCEAVSEFLSGAPEFTNNMSVDMLVNDDYSVDLDFSIDDSDVIDINSIQYRVDYNLNGEYDEAWQDYTITRSQNSPTISRTSQSSRDNQTISIPITVTSSGIYIYEIRAMDSYGQGFGFSGNSFDEGIDDDWSFEYSYLSAVSNPEVSYIYLNAVNVSWDIYNGDRFTEFRIDYADNAEFTNGMSITSTEEPSLADINTSSIDITDLTDDTEWFFKVATVYNQYIAESGAVTFILALPPNISDLTVANIYYSNTQDVIQAVVDFELSSSFTIDTNSIQYRVDYNLYGVYDEAWEDYSQPILVQRTVSNRETLRTNRNTESISITLDLPSEGDYAYELRVQNQYSDAYGYSGSLNQVGITDDNQITYILDEVSPADITTFVVVGTPTETEATLGWLVSSDANFYRYEIYYGVTAGINITDNLWSETEDAEMLDIGATYKTTVINILNPGTQYFFRIRAVDLAGNASALSVETSAITTGGANPAVPENIILYRDGANMVLDWDDVVTDVNGQPMTIISYKIYANITPDFEIIPLNLIGNSATSDFTHLNVLSRSMFYKIKTVVGRVGSRSSSAFE